MLYCIGFILRGQFCLDIGMVRRKEHLAIDSSRMKLKVCACHIGFMGDPCRENAQAGRPMKRVSMGEEEWTRKKKSGQGRRRVEGLMLPPSPSAATESLADKE